jgi:hypothetical protein
MNVCDDIHGCNKMSLGQMENERGSNYAMPFDWLLRF